MARVPAEAEQADAAEDAQYGQARGDEVDLSWHDRDGRRERLRAAKARIEARRQADRDAQAAKTAAVAERDIDELDTAEQPLAAQIAMRLDAAQA